jgi:3-methylfumaryl-CoA hydratase
MSEAADLQGWVGRRQVTNFTVEPWPAAALSAALGRDDPPGLGEPLPPFWHHLYGLPVVTAGETGPDGHPMRGGFLPPVPLPRRMWAGGRLGFTDPLLIGDQVERASEVKSITHKQGRQGPLAFVLVEHRFTTGRGLALTEEHDIVYREPAGAAAAPPGESAAASPAWRRRWLPDEVMLFRYSALTYNGHRIHYDQPYATAVEGYPGLVVHGPLLATLILDLLRRERPQVRLERFAFRAVQPVFVGQEIDIQGEPEGASGAQFSVIDRHGALAMRAEAVFA